MQFKTFAKPYVRGLESSVSFFLKRNSTYTYISKVYFGFRQEKYMDATYS